MSALPVEKKNVISTEEQKVEEDGTSGASSSSQEEDLFDSNFVQSSQQSFKSAAENDVLLARFFDINNYRLEYDDLNDCVTALLRKSFKSSYSSL